MKRIEREADRSSRGNPSLSQAPPGVWDGAEDLLSGAARSRQAERIVRRSVRGVLSDRLEAVARGIPGLDVLFRSDDARRQPDGLPTRPPSGADHQERPGEPRGGAPGATFGFRLDAHPRLIVRGRFGSLSGALEVPLLEREIRIAIEEPLGARGRVAARGGFSADRGAWGAVAFTLKF